MRRWLILCLLAACERAGDAQNPLGTGGELATGPTGPRAIVDASVATLPNDAAPIARPIATDAAVARAPADAAVARAPADARRAVDVAMSEADAARIADLLTSDHRPGRDVGDMSRRMPGSDLGRQLDDVKSGGGTRVAIGGSPGRGVRGDGNVRVGMGGGTKVDGPGSDKTTVGRVVISSQRAFDQSTLTDAVVVQKVRIAYMAGIKRCYVVHLKKDATARGRVTLAVKVGETGAGRGSSASGFVKEIDDCVTNLMGSWRFPIPKDKDGEATTANFEIVLQLVPD